MNFDEVIAIHEEWKIKLRNDIKIDSKDLDPHIIEKDSQSSFGKWIYGEGLIYSRWKKQFEALKFANKEFHKSAAEAVMQLNNGNKSKAEELISADSNYMKHSMSLIDKVKDLKDIAIHFNVLQSLLKYQSISSFYDILHSFNYSNVDDTIQIIQSEKDNEIFITFLVYYCYIFRLEENIMILLNHQNFPNYILIKIIFFNFGRSIILQRDSDEYFTDALLFISPSKSMDLLLNSDIVNMDLNVTLHLLQNLNMDNVNKYFSQILNLEETLDLYIELFQDIGAEGMRKFSAKNLDLYSYIIVLMIAYKDKVSVSNFLSNNKDNINLIDQLGLLTVSIKKHFNYESEIKLSPSKRDQNHLLIIINEIKDFSNILDVVNILYNQGVFIDEFEKDIIYNIITDPFLKEHVLNHLSNGIRGNQDIDNIFKSSLE